VRRVAVVINPISGAAPRERALAEFHAALAAGGVEARLRPTRRAGDAAVIAKEEADAGVEAVVAAGGDGTVNEVARGLVDLGAGAPSLAVLPRGTSNLVARELGLPKDARAAARVVVEGARRRMDVGFANGRLFVACVGAGWDAHVVRLLAQSRKGHITFSTWLKPIAKATFDYDFAPLRVVAEDGSSAEGEVAMIFNGRPYAAFFVLTPDARPDDGVLDAIVLRKRGALDVARWAWKGLRGTLGDDAAATVLRSKTFRIESAKPLPVQIDGDVGGETPVDILVRPAALSVLVPAERKDS